MAKNRQGSSATSTINISMRIDPKTKYLIDLLARDQKRTLTGVVEWAIEVAAARERFHNTDNNYDGPSFLDMLDALWSTDEAIRLVALAIHKPSLLDYHELRIWETLKASPSFWNIKNPHTTSNLQMDHLNLGMLQCNWDDFLEHVNQNRAKPAIEGYYPEVPF
ncbi:hypothetical protein [Alloalcanivorax venustensis]|jgi:uncharacterized protein (DUF1778 family)|uniref:hypothetical protein n=1 Tax=Alloalcanivorax venustensis TaxID=172371 RepID=UPI0039E72099